ncbi:MAG TPA: hypothetical protein VF096_08960 [Azonexus sp.]
MYARTDPPAPSSFFADWLTHGASIAAYAAWSAASDGERMPAMAHAGTVAVAESRFPVWRAIEGEGGEPAPEGKFVCYCDLPAELAAGLREQQVLAGKPFAGAAYLEDFQLFIELRQRRR